MDFLRLEPDKQYELTLESDEWDVVDRHWENGRSYEHTDDNCIYCRANVPKRKEYSLEVTCEGRRYTWSLTEGVASAIIAAGGPKSGMTLTVHRLGKGAATRYQVDVVGIRGIPTPAVGDSDDVWEMLIMLISTMRHMANDLEEVLIRHGAHPALPPGHGQGGD